MGLENVWGKGYSLTPEFACHAVRVCPDHHSYRSLYAAPTTHQRMTEFLPGTAGGMIALTPRNFMVAIRFTYRRRHHHSLVITPVVVHISLTSTIPVVEFISTS